MNYRLSYMLGFVVSGLMAFAVSPANSQTTSAGPYYATPSLDQQLPASSRFIVLSNWVDVNFPSGGAAVLDRETGLVWQRSPSTSTFAWDIGEASFHCAN